MIKFTLSFLSAAVLATGATIPASDSSISAEFPTDIGYFGVTATSDAPFLAATDAAAITFGRPTSSYTLPQPIETTVQGKDSKPGDRNIFTLMGTISPYYVSEGWGVYDWGLPEQCDIKQVHLLSRHGSRYPTNSISTGTLLDKKNYTVTGELEFLKDWHYSQGVNVLTKLGNQQLFDKGVRTFFRYGALYEKWGENNTTPHKLVARTTSQERITASSEYFLAGFFGLDWQNYANLEIIVESKDFNDTLASYDNCPINDKIGDIGTSGKVAEKFYKKYLSKAVERLNKQINGITLTTDNVYDFQKICSYEVNNNGYSPFCGLFTQKEWEDYEYYLSWTWYNDNMFGSPTARALGIGWVEEFKQRLANSNEFDWSTLGVQNTTLNTNPNYFPTNQSLYFDFSHDSTITNIYTALGFQQFRSNFTDDGELGGKETPFDLSKITPFASQTYFEVVECSSEIPAKRSNISDFNPTSNNTNKYIHVILNDHTLPLHKNVPEYCEERDDGWCDFDKFFEYLGTLYDQSDFTNSCFTGDYNISQLVTDGKPEY